MIIQIQYKMGYYIYKNIYNEFIATIIFKFKINSFITLFIIKIINFSVLENIEIKVDVSKITPITFIWIFKLIKII